MNHGEDRWRGGNKNTDGEVDKVNWIARWVYKVRPIDRCMDRVGQTDRWRDG